MRKPKGMISTYMRNAGLRYNLSDIVRLEADGSYTYVYLKDGQKMTLSYHLGHFEDQLSRSTFLRIHHKHYVNTAFVARYDRRYNMVQLTDGTWLNIAKRRRHDIKGALVPQLNMRLAA